MASAEEIARAADARDIRDRWLLSAPALVIILLAAIGPLFVMLAYSFMLKGDYGDVQFGTFSLDGWTSVLFQRDIFDDTLGLADAHLAIFWRSISLSSTPPC
jgi:spermidine/putrescine transport system permease protein